MLLSGRFAKHSVVKCIYIKKETTLGGSAMKKPMKKLAKLCLVLALSASVLFGGSVAAQAGGYTCTDCEGVIGFMPIDFDPRPHD